MQRIIQSIKAFTGRNDANKIKIHNILNNSDENNNYLYGKVIHLSTQDIRYPVISFPYFTDPSKKHYKELYVYGKYYFDKNGKVDSISKLTPYFKTYVNDISFCGYMYHNAYGVLGMVAIGDSMYMTNADHIYKRVGNKSDFVPNNIISLFYDGTEQFVIDTEGRLFYAIVTYNSNLVAHIEIKGERSFESSILFLHPMCCSVYIENDKKTFTYVNRDCGFIMLNKTRVPTVVTSGEIEVDLYVLGSANGTHYEYSLVGSSPSEMKAMPTLETQVMDTLPSLKEYSYNNLQQLTATVEESSIWNKNRTGFDGIRRKETSYKYLWNSSEPLAQIAANTAIGLLDSVTELLQNSDTEAQLRTYLNKLFTAYKKVVDHEETDRLVYQSISTADGTAENKKVVTNEVIKYNLHGFPEIVGGVIPENGKNARLISISIYSKKLPGILIASFNGVTYDGINKAVGYSGFEPYEEVDSSNNKAVSTPYFTFWSGRLENISVAGTRSVYFYQNGYVSMGSGYGLSANSQYLFSFYQKTGDGRWEYRQIVKKGSELPSNAKIIDIPSNTYLDGVAIREVSCELQINLYRECDYRQIGSIDSNGVLTKAILDNAGRIICSYVESMANESGKYVLTGELALNQIDICGYARLGGRNCTEDEGISILRFNTIVQCSFRQNAKYISFEDNISLSDQKSVYIMGKGDFFADFIETSGGITVKLSCNRVEVSGDGYRSDSIVLSKDRRPKAYNWSLCFKNNVLILIVDGALVRTWVFTKVFVKLCVKRLGDYYSNLGRVIWTQDFDIQIGYYDFLGRLVQSQTIREMYGRTRLILESFWYNCSNQIVARSLKGAYPADKTKALVDSDHPLSYRDGFANIKWSTATENEPRGILNGELATYYKSGVGKEMLISPDDYKYPYYYAEFETGANRRQITSAQPGVDGYSLCEKFDFHDKETYSAYANSYTNLNIDYGSINNKVDISSKNTRLSQYQFFDKDAIVYGSSIKTSALWNDSINYKIKNGLVDNRVPGVLAVGKTYYAIKNENNVSMGEYFAAYNRIHVIWGQDYGYRISIKDVYGNVRLILTNFDVNGKEGAFFKYDKMNRLLLSGYMTFNKAYTIQELLDTVADPEFPREHAINLYEFVYDSIENGFSIGKLCKVKANGDVTTYTYDYLGHTTNVHNELAELGSNIIKNTKYKLDNLANILEILNDYSTSQYQYHDNNVTQIQYDKDTFVIRNCEYDIYNRLVSYIDVNGINIKYAYDILGRQKFIGQVQSSSNIAVEKRYSKKAGMLQRLESLVYADGNTNESLEYDDFLRLIGLENYEHNMAYDKNGNLISFDATGENWTMEYNPNTNQIQKAHSSSRKNISFGYNSNGVITYFNHQDEVLDFTPDPLFISKIASIKQGVHMPQTWELQYDLYGRLCAMRSNNTFNIYLYGLKGNLERMIKCDGHGEKSNTVFVNIGTQVIAQKDSETSKWIGLCYDNAKTLRISTYGNTVKVHHYNAWGKPQEEDLDKITFYYMGMQYIKDLGLYIDNGVFYSPDFGLTFSPILESSAFTPYRQLLNNPIM